MKKLCARDSLGLYCPRNIEGEARYNPDPKIVALFNAPAKYCVLNYSKEKINEIIPRGFI